MTEIRCDVIREHEDGSADVMLTYDKEGLAFLIQEGMHSILRSYIEQKKKEGYDPTKIKTKRRPKDVKKTPKTYLR